MLPNKRLQPTRSASLRVRLNRRRSADQLEVARDGHGQVPRRRHTLPLLGQAPQAPCIRRKSQLAENQ